MSEEDKEDAFAIKLQENEQRRLNELEDALKDFMYKNEELQRQNSLLRDENDKILKLKNDQKQMSSIQIE